MQWFVGRGSPAWLTPGRRRVAAKPHAGRVPCARLFCFSPRSVLVRNQWSGLCRPARRAPASGSRLPGGPARNGGMEPTLPPARRFRAHIDDCVWERDPAAFRSLERRETALHRELQICRPRHNRERPATLRRSCRTAHSLQHRGHGFQHHIAPKPEKPALRAGLPRRRRLTASGTRLPTPHRAEAGETRFAGGTSVLTQPEASGRRPTILLRTKTGKTCSVGGMVF